MPSRSRCAELNNPCDPAHFTTIISDVKVDNARPAFSFDAKMTAEGFGNDAEQAIPPQTVHYDCVFSDGTWVLR